MFYFYVGIKSAKAYLVTQKSIWLLKNLFSYSKIFTNLTFSQFLTEE